MSSLPLRREANADSDFFKLREKKSRARSPALKEKKEQGFSPCSKNCVDPIFPQNWI
jgi:hypothetical protein